MSEKPRGHLHFWVKTLDADLRKYPNPGPLADKIIRAAKGKDVSVHCIDKLIGKGADVNEKENGETPLHCAVKVNNIPAAEALIGHGADVNIPDNYDNTALHLAVEKGSLRLVNLLIDNNAKVNARDGNGETPFDTAEELHEDERDAAKKKRAEEIKVALKRAGGKRGSELD